MNKYLRSALFVSTAVAGVLSSIGSTTLPANGGKSTVLDARTGTKVDGHGNTDVSTRPASCLVTAPPFPDAPDVWWQTISPSVRQVAPMTGYRVWSNMTPPAGCPHDFRTEVYRGFYEFDITPFLGKSGAIMKVIARVSVRGSSVSPVSIGEPPALPTNAFLCDNVTAGAFQLMRIPPAVVFSNGVDVLNGVDTASATNPPRIPNALPAGTRVLNFPTKTPSDPGTGSTPRSFEADITQDFVATLQAFEASNTNPPAPPRFARMTFMMKGTNEPPALKNGPLPFTDCRGAYSVVLDVREP